MNGKHEEKQAPRIKEQHKDNAAEAKKAAEHSANKEERAHKTRPRN